MTPETTDMLKAREQLMDDIDYIVHDGFLTMFGWEDVDGWDEQRSEMIKVLCDAVSTYLSIYHDQRY